MEIEYTDDWFVENVDNFDLWFDPETFDWHEGSWLLGAICSKYFNKWFDPDTFGWDMGASWSLPYSCSDCFDVWWDSEKYEWNDDGWALANYCSEHFDKWWDKDKFNWDHSLALAHCGKDFETWWDKDKFNWDYSDDFGDYISLAEYCGEYFDVWWDADKFDWDHVDDLFENCIKYCNVWCQDRRCKAFLLNNLLDRFDDLRGEHGYLPIVKVNNGN